MAISYQPNNANKQLFLKGKYKSTGFVFAFLISLILIFIDTRSHVISPLRTVIAFAVSPIQYTVDYPVRMISWVRALVGSKKGLVDENMQLRYQQTILEAELQKLLVIQNENSQLKELLSASSSATTRAMAAEILAVDSTSSRHLLVLNKGKRDAVFVGQPVLDAKGVTGQVIDVGVRTSTVLLISDAKSAVPVRNNRTGERGILIGTNNLNQLSLINLPKSSSIEKGDLLVTSGLGRRYPEGYPVGKVEEIRNLPGDDFIRVKVAPVAQLNRSRLVLLIWPDKEEIELTAQIDERIKNMRSDDVKGDTRG